MPYTDYNRYNILKTTTGVLSTMPFVSIPKNASDKYEYWNIEFSRLDKLSQKYYGNPFYDFLIMYANPSYVNEFDIPDNTLIRIPFPLAKVKGDYDSALLNYKNNSL